MSKDSRRPFQSIAPAAPPHGQQHECPDCARLRKEFEQLRDRFDALLAPKCVNCGNAATHRSQTSEFFPQQEWRCNSCDALKAKVA